MKILLQILSLAALLLTIVPPVMFFSGMMSHSAQNTWMFAGTVLWFISASAWLGRREKTQEK